MRIGYPCINRTIGCTTNRTFRLASYSDERLLATVGENLACLERVLAWNCEHGLLFFRISSDLVPFASHPVCTAPWQEAFADRFAAIGRSIRGGGMRISMHPDQFNLLNAKDPTILERTIAELGYHVEVLDLLGLGYDAKVQIHVGGVYGDREASIRRFIDVYGRLAHPVRRRLVIENDDGRYSIDDCLRIGAEVGVPVLFDRFHHEIYGTGRQPGEVLDRVAETWRPADGVPMVDYSTQAPGRRPGAHAETIDRAAFAGFLSESRDRDLDIMLEIKDKEQSALVALGLARNDPRLVTGPVS